MPIFRAVPRVLNSDMSVIEDRFETIAYSLSSISMGGSLPTGVTNIYAVKCQLTKEEKCFNISLFTRHVETVRGVASKLPQCECKTL